MNRHRIFVAIAAVLLAVSALPRVAPAQDQALDTVNLAYHFTRGQQVTYRVVTQDSIVLWDSVPRVLTAQRVEVIAVRCDDILPEGFVMSEKLVDYVATESRPGVAQVVRRTHPWVGRTVRFLMSRSGERLKLVQTDSTQQMAPCGPLRTEIMPDLFDSITWVGASKNFESAYWSFDNSYPPVYWKGHVFRVVSDRKDTMGTSAIAVDLSRVGRIDYRMPGSPITNAAVINGAGTFYFSPELGHIVAGDASMIANLTLSRDDAWSITGRQVLSMTFSQVEPSDATDGGIDRGTDSDAPASSDEGTR